jgi:hypothetical protein
MMYCPSGLHAGTAARTKGSVKTARGLPPSASITHRLYCPRRSLMKAMERPSGEMRGCVLIAIPEFCVSATASPPATGRR